MFRVWGISGSGRDRKTWGEREVCIYIYIHTHRSMSAYVDMNMHAYIRVWELKP